VKFSLNLSDIYTNWCAESFPPIFGLLAILGRNFAKLVAPPGNVNEKYVVHLTQQSLLKEPMKMLSKSTHKPAHNTYLNYVPHAQADEA